MPEYKITNITPLNELSRKHIKALNNAIEGAEKSPFESSLRVGAYLKDSSIAFNGTNQFRKCPWDNRYYSLHAEMSAIMRARKTRKYISSGSIYVVRLLKDVNGLEKHLSYRLGCAKPCKTCSENLLKHNIKKIFYTDYINNVNVLCEMRIVV